MPCDKKAIYYFSSNDYGFLKQRPQQLFNEWRGNFSETKTFLYIEPFRSEIKLKRSPFENVHRSPFYFYFTKYGIPQLECINDFFINRTIRKCWSGSRVAIACTSLWEPYLDKGNFDFICYDYLDALEVHAGAKNFDLLKARHERLIAKSDIVFVTAEKLKQEVCAAHPGKQVVMVSNGVDFSFFQEKRRAMVPADYRKSDRKVVGYVGAIFDWIDLELVHAAARLTPELDYLMVGPVSGTNSALVVQKPGNVYYLGAKPYDQVPSYIDLFDLALIPFVKSNISESTDPIKLYEYFALGKPVVATPMLQLNRFNDGNKLSIADNAASFSEAVRALIAGDSAELRAQRQEVARLNSWASKAAIMIDSVDALLQGKAKN
jgi:glycosyltransferase involved in cell wall biosynthesis